MDISKEANRRNDVLSHQLDFLSLICSGAKTVGSPWNPAGNLLECCLDRFFLEYLTGFMSYLWDEINFDESQH
jgi:hypothetical protein